MIIYFTALFLTFFSYYIPKIKVERTYINLYFILTFAVVTLLGCIRYDVGSDFMQYLSFFIQRDYFSGRFEYGYSLFNYIINSIFGTPKAFFIFSNIFIMLFFLTGILRNSVDIKMSLFLFIFGFFYFDSLNAIRQYMAISMIFFSHSLLFKKKNFSFAFMVLIATLFHYSAVLGFLLIPLFKTNIKKKNTLFFVLLLIFLYVFNSHITNFVFSIIESIPFLSKYFIYSSLLNIDSSSKPFEFFFYLMIFIFTFFNKRKTERISQEKQFYYKNVLLALFFKVLALNFHLFDRLSTYFSIFIILYIPILLIDMNSRHKLLYKYMLMFIFLIYCFVRIQSGQAGVLEYHIYK